MDGPQGQGAEPPRALILALLAVYLAFVLYGSFVPFDFASVPLDVAITRFRTLPAPQLGLGSRSDWGANILLFIPLGLLATALALARVRGLRGAAAAGAIALILAALSAGIEFVQIFFPSRTTSLNDIIAESIGGIIGIAAWTLCGEHLLAFASGWRRWVHGRDAFDWLAKLYVALVVAYGMLPLDLTISPVEVYHKWAAGRVFLRPFSYPYRDADTAFYNMTTDAAIWIVPALLWVLSARASAPAVVVRCTAIAAGIEAAQLFVWSRTTDVTSVLMALVGAGLGAAVAVFPRDRLGRAQVLSPAPDAAVPPAAWLACACALVWAGIVLFLFWYPFDFLRDPHLIAHRVTRGLSTLPLHAFFYESELRAATGLLRRIVLLAPFGGFLGVAAVMTFRRAGALSAAAAALLSLAFAGLIEIGNAALPRKVFDSASLIAAFLGAFGGYLLAVELTRAVGRVQSRTARS